VGGGSPRSPSPPPPATRSVEEGADGIVWLAAEPLQNLTGKFLQDRKVIPW
jgi:hypothetical protein